MHPVSHNTSQCYRSSDSIRTPPATRREKTTLKHSWKYTLLCFGFRGVLPALLTWRSLESQGKAVSLAEACWTPSLPELLTQELPLRGLNTPLGLMKTAVSILPENLRHALHAHGYCCRVQAQKPRWSAIQRAAYVRGAILPHWHLCDLLLVVHDLYHRDLPCPAMHTD